VTYQRPGRPPQKSNQWTDRKGVPLLEVQEAKPLGGFQGRALRIAQIHASLLAISVLAMTSPTQAALRCPPLMPSVHTGFARSGPVPTAHWQLWKMRLFDGLPGEELKTSPAELAPDSTTAHRGGFTSTWTFAGNETLLMVCVYNGSGTYYYASPGPLTRSCVAERSHGLTQAWCE
jgi:hypothetical protein